MPRTYTPPSATDEQRSELETLARSRTEEARLVQRAQAILDCLGGKPIKEIADRLGTMPNTVINWRKRFEEKGMAGLQDRPRPGKPPKYDKSFRDRVLATLELPPPKGQACWDGAALALHLEASDDAVWRVLRREGISLSRRRSWCVSTDPQFAVKAADVVGLYLNPPENAVVICVDEKPSIQAIERPSGYVCTSSGKIVRGLKSTYKRNGTLNLLAALTVATGAIKAVTTEYKRRKEFLEFMDEVVADYTDDIELHVIVDNSSIHKGNDEWLSKHPNVHFHFTPTSASWLNLVEVWFGIFSRKALRGASFKDISALRQAIEDFIAAYGPTAKPFIWRKREVKGAQLQNTIANLCN